MGFVSATTPGGGGSIASRSWNHTISSGSNRVLAIKTYFGDSIQTVSNVTVNLVSATFIDRVRGGNGTTDPWGGEGWQYVNPPSGSVSIVVTLPAAAEMWTNSEEFDGIDQTTPVRAGSAQKQSVVNGNPASVTVPCQVGDTVTDMIGMDSATPSANQSQTMAFTPQNPSDGQASGYKTAASTSVTMGYAAGGAAGLLAWAFAAAGGSSPVTLIVPLLTNSSTLYAPAVGISAHIVQPPLITSGVTLYAPQIAYGGLSLALPLLGSSALLYAPAVGVAANILQPPLITSGVTLYAPVIQEGVPVGTIAPPFLPGTALLFAPLIVPGAGTIFAPLLGSTVILYPPRIGLEDLWSPCTALTDSEDWAPCRPGSDLLLATIVESPYGGWRVTTDPDAEPVATLAESERGGFTVDPSMEALGGALLESDYAVGILDPDRTVPIADDYHPLISPEWADC